MIVYRIKVRSVLSGWRWRVLTTRRRMQQLDRPWTGKQIFERERVKMLARKMISAGTNWHEMPKKRRSLTEDYMDVANEDVKRGWWSMFCGSQSERGGAAVPRRLANPQFPEETTSPAA